MWHLAIAHTFLTWLLLLSQLPTSSPVFGNLGTPPIIWDISSSQLTKFVLRFISGYLLQCLVESCFKLLWKEFYSFFLIIFFVKDILFYIWFEDVFSTWRWLLWGNVGGPRAPWLACLVEGTRSFGSPARSQGGLPETAGKAGRIRRRSLSAGWEMKGQWLPGSKKHGLKEAASGERPAKLIKCGSSLPCSLAENPPEPFGRDLDISKGPCELNEDPRAETLQMSVRWGPLNAV